MKANPCVEELIKDLQDTAKRNGGYIHGLDGRRVYIRHHHAILNSLIQSAGSVIFKAWMIRVDRLIVDNNFEMKQVLEMHDELLMETHPMNSGLAVLYGDMMCEEATKAGEGLGLKVPITAEAKVGKTYAEVH